MELPPCGNFKAGTCERNEVYIARETDDAFIIACRCCQSMAVWPKDKAENLGRYEAWMKHKAAREAQVKFESGRKAYGF